VGRILVKLRQHLAQPTDITFQYPYEEFFSNVVEHAGQNSCYLSPLSGDLDDRESPVAPKNVAPDESAGLKAIYKTSDLSFVSTKRDRQLSRGGISRFNATKKNSCFLERHAKLQEATVQ
jgi:hypothetical protein